MKPNLTWTKADSRRAEKMGWMLAQRRCVVFDTDERRICCTTNDRFKSDDEAARWVVDQVDLLSLHLQSVKTCRKAVLICCGGVI